MSSRKSRPQKRRRRSIIAFEMIRLDRTATEPLHEQLYRQIREITAASRDKLRARRGQDWFGLCYACRSVGPATETIPNFLRA